MKDCIFCKIAAGELECFKIYEDEEVLAFLDIARDSFGHTLVIPKKHCKNIADCDSDTLETVFAAVQKITAHYIANCGFAGVNIVTNVESQQAVGHLHVHIFPRKKEEEMLKLFETGSVEISLLEQQKVLKLA